MTDGRASKRLLAVAAAATATFALGGASVAGSADADTIQTVVGTGAARFGTSGDQARETAIDRPRGASPTSGGGIVWAEPATHTVRSVGPDGIVTKVAGTPGRAGTSGDGGPAIVARLDRPTAALATSGGDILVVDTANDRIRSVDGKGVIRTVAGIGSAGYSGDGGPATAARLRNPTGIALLAAGGFLIADAGNHVIRRVLPDGSISTVAGTGARGYSGDGGKAVTARLSAPWAVAALGDGGFLVADSGNQRIRRVGSDGTISTIAGSGARGYGGDGGPATSAALADPHGVAALGGGAFLIADTGNHRIRRVAEGGTIGTFAGTGAAGAAGDGGPAASAQLVSPESVSVTPTGGVLISDTGNNRIRLVGVASRPVNVMRPRIAGDSGIGGTLSAWAGGWRGTGPAITYRWQRCDLDGRRCKGIDGATVKTYRVRGRDFGFTLRVRVAAANAADSAAAVSETVGVGRLVRETIVVRGGGGDDGAIRGLLERGAKPRVALEGFGTSIGVERRRLTGSTWRASVGLLRFDTPSLDDRIRLESASLLLYVLNARSDDRLGLVVHSCPGTWPIDAGDFRTIAPRGGARVAVARVRRGAAVFPLSDPDDVSLKAKTEVCLYLSGRIPRGQNTLTFASQERSARQAPALLITYRVR